MLNQVSRVDPGRWDGRMRPDGRTGEVVDLRLWMRSGHYDGEEDDDAKYGGPPGGSGTSQII